MIGLPTLVRGPPPATYFRVGAIVSRKCDVKSADDTAVLASAAFEVGLTQTDPRMGAVFGAVTGATLGAKGGIPGLIAGAMAGESIGRFAAVIPFDEGTRVLNVLQWDSETLSKGLHWGVHVGHGRIIELLDDGKLHEAWLGSGAWNCDVGIIREGGNRAADRAKQEFLNNPNQGYDLVTNNCRDFCRRCYN